MSDDMFCSETEVETLIFETAATVDVKPVVFVAKRETLKENRFAYNSTFAVQTSAGNEALITALMKMTLEKSNIKFNGSDVDIQGGNLMVDFIWMEATITPNLA